MPAVVDVAASGDTYDASADEKAPGADGSSGAVPASGDAADGFPSAQASSSVRGGCSVGSGAGCEGGPAVGLLGLLTATLARRRHRARRSDTDPDDIGARGTKGWIRRAVGHGFQRSAVVGVFTCALAPACGGPATLAPDAVQDEVGPSCPYGIPQFFPPPSGDCWDCLDCQVPGFVAAYTCPNYWTCFCNCDPGDTSCYRDCESNIDLACAKTWSQILYVSQSNCDVKGFVGCKSQCAGQSFPVSTSDLLRIQGQLGGAAMFATTCPTAYSCQ